MLGWHIEPLSLARILKHVFCALCKNPWADNAGGLREEGHLWYCLLMIVLFLVGWMQTSKKTSIAAMIQKGSTC